MLSLLAWMLLLLNNIVPKLDPPSLIPVCPSDSNLGCPRVKLGSPLQQDGRRADQQHTDRFRSERLFLIRKETRLWNDEIESHTSLIFCLDEIGNTHDEGDGLNSFTHAHVVRKNDAFFFQNPSNQEFDLSPTGTLTFNTENRETSKEGDGEEGKCFCGANLPLLFGSRAAERRLI